MLMLPSSGSSSLNDCPNSSGKGLVRMLAPQNLMEELFLVGTAYQGFSSGRGNRCLLMMENIALISAAAGAFGLAIAFMLYQQVNKVKIDNETVADITDEIQKGAMAFLFA
ncbi:MAG: hypothetical protein DWC05_03560, partial [Candidatus Poseidoniales archaeon]